MKQCMLRRVLASGCNFAGRARPRSRRRVGHIRCARVRLLAPPAPHPHAVALCPQALALVIYMFGSVFSSSFVNIFICCVLLLAFDFWTVKNVTGRLMVGLRWWSEVKEDGSTVWRYEAQEVRAATRHEPAKMQARAPHHVKAAARRDGDRTG